MYEISSRANNCSKHLLSHFFFRPKKPFFFFDFPVAPVAWLAPILLMPSYSPKKSDDALWDIEGTGASGRVLDLARGFDLDRVRPNNPFFCFGGAALLSTAGTGEADRLNKPDPLLRRIGLGLRALPRLLLCSGPTYRRKVSSISLVLGEEDIISQTSSTVSLIVLFPLTAASWSPT